MRLPKGFFSRHDIAAYRSIFEELPEGSRVAELGSYKGRSICSVADLILAKNMSIEIIDVFHRILEIDTYKKCFEGDAPQSMQIFTDNAKRFGLLGNMNVHALMSDEAAASYADHYFDFVFIDADHSYDAVMKDITNWRSKVKPGGILAGHDFDRHAHPGVVKAVESLAPNATVIGQSTIWKVVAF